MKSRLLEESPFSPAATKDQICPVTGKLIRRWPSRGWKWLVLPLLGLVALFWFLVRVLPKPSRAAYPCQRVAFPIASGFVLWVAALLVSALAWRKARAPRLALWDACLWGVVAVVGVSFVAAHLPMPKASAAPLPSHAPLGTGRGVFPGRVAWVHDPAACKWPGTSGYWWESRNTDQAVVVSMMSKTVRWLSGKPTDAEAWDALFRNFNQAHARGDVGYRPGEKIAIKCNLNNSGATWGNSQNTSPQIIRALLWQLTHQAGVTNQANITVCDPTRVIGDAILAACTNEFPNVVYLDKDGGAGRVAARPATNAALNAAIYFGDSRVWSHGARYPATAFTDATYVIDLGVLRGHNLAGITACAKNWFGATWTQAMGWSPAGPDEMNSMHGYVAANDFSWGPGWTFAQRPMGSYNALVDLMGHKHLGGKTVLFLVDGLYAARDQSSGNVIRWASPPFKNRWTASLFASQDGVAIDSVCLDFLRAETLYSTNYDGIVTGTLENYLHEAAQADHPPSGTVYAPNQDRVRLASLGVHEHWNNPLDKQYSRNLGAREGIELVTARPALALCRQASQPACAVSSPAGERCVLEQSTNLRTWAGLVTNTAPFTNPMATDSAASRGFYRARVP